ncbi:unnamed protein product [Gemmata massiliana]|uniref:Uncharacterized protein n=1 Tax=Gemmata massiliana TaxID=1210884 RepID=A0A6P2D4B8_9BACT|nr:unnamed protein product [Gemmata massiliana]
MRRLHTYERRLSLPAYGAVLGWALVIGGGIKPVWIGLLLMRAEAEDITWRDVGELFLSNFPTLAIVIVGAILVLGYSRPKRRCDQ